MADGVMVRSPAKLGMRSDILAMKLPRQLEMTTTRADFLRLLPAAVDHVAFAEEGEAFVHREGARGWRIGLQPLPALRIGQVRLERHQVDFDFSGFTPAEIETFMARFELYFHRGGG
jgi:hypothetical protein